MAWIWWSLVGAASVVSIVFMTAGAASDDRLLSVFSAGLFAALAVFAAVRLNMSTLQVGSHANRRAELVSLNAGLLAVAFAWGGVTILAGYYLTDLFWHHAWQYGLGMCLAGLMSSAMAWHLNRPDCFLREPHWLQRMTLLSGLLVIGSGLGLTFLVLSGKLMRDNVDWLANHVFVAGGIVVVAISAIAVWSQNRAGQ